MITSLAWVPRGAARARPVRFELSQEEMQRVRELARDEQEVADAEEARESAAAIDLDDDNDAGAGIDGGEGAIIDVSDLPPELRMEDYDKEDYEEDEEGDEDHSDDEAFDVMENGPNAIALDAGSDDEDAEDDQILPTDSILVVAMTDDEYSHLEVHIFADDGNLYVHHDISLPDFPLSLAWMDCPPFRYSDGDPSVQQEVGSYIAVGTFNPAIEIWNLDVLDPLEPTAVLGGLAPVSSSVSSNPSRKGKKKSERRREEYLPGSHEDAVMALSWNKEFRQALASGSADKTVKIWDVTTQVCSHTFTHHTDKVQCVLWHPEESWLLATGAFDRGIALLDCRSASLTHSYRVSADLEAMTWDPFCSFHLYSALEDGNVVCIDTRKPDSPLFSFPAHEKTASGLTFSHSIPGMLATASVDKTVKVWDVGTAAQLSHEAKKGGKKEKKKAVEAAGVFDSSAALSSSYAPQLVAYKSMNVGKLFSVAYYYDDPFLLAAAGDKGMVAIWETDELTHIKDRFEGRVLSRVSAYAGLQEGGHSASMATADSGGALEDVVDNGLFAVEGGAVAVEDSGMGYDGLGDGDLDERVGEIIGTGGGKKEKKNKKKKNKK